MASGDMGAVAAPRVRLAKLGTCLRVVSTHRLRWALRGQGRGPWRLHIGAGLCRPTSADESAPGGLMGHLETPSLRSSVKDLGFELAGRPAIRATGVVGKYIHVYIYIYIYIYTYIIYICIVFVIP